MDKEQVVKVLEGAARGVCLECGGKKALWPEGPKMECSPCPSCKDSDGVSTGRRWPELGLACPWMFSGTYGEFSEYKCAVCQDTGIVPDLSSDALDATAERAEFPTINSTSLPNGTYFYCYSTTQGESYQQYSAGGPTRNEARQAALAEVLVKVGKDE